MNMDIMHQQIGEKYEFIRWSGNWRDSSKNHLRDWTKKLERIDESDEMIKILHLTNVHHAKTLLQHMDRSSNTVRTRSREKIAYKGLTGLNLASETLLHNKIINNGINERFSRIYFYTDFWFDQHQPGNWSRNILICALFSRVKVVWCSDSKSHKTGFDALGQP